MKDKRCLDVGTWDGFYAYELERRGASEVVALDLLDLTDLDYPPEVAADSGFDSSRSDTQPRQAGFKLLHDLLGSRVEFRGGSIYDLDPVDIGQFDVVVAGSLLVHLRDPVRALDAVRRVTRGSFLSIDYVHPPLNLLPSRRPLFELRGMSDDFQWWLASNAGYQHMLHVAGFTIERSSRYFLLRPGPDQAGKRRSVKGLGKQLVNRAVARDSAPGGHLHRAHLTQPRF